MTITHAFFLGILQGLSELLPVSSSGHLALAEKWFGFQANALSQQGFDVVLHAGTLVALLGCYFPQWARLTKSIFVADADGRRLLASLVIATVPAVIAGLLLQKFLAEHMRDPRLIAFSFLATAGILTVAELFGQRRIEQPLSYRRALWIGLAQSCALIPGLSRSGLTISAGRASGLKRSEALDFSFLMAAPIIGGAFVLTLFDMAVGRVVLPTFSIVLSGFVASAVASMCAIVGLREFVRTHSLAWFALYLIPSATIILMWWH
ncbi:MAG: undecaprenyl-diphosphate phosphatase [Candidatus Peribacteraceae bacterium]|nr:undecaprenyl-diphosphate phosphatase [Candidatus Peribacteraceae bacterium]